MVIILSVRKKISVGEIDTLSRQQSTVDHLILAFLSCFHALAFLQVSLTPFLHENLVFIRDKRSDPSSCQQSRVPDGWRETCAKSSFQTGSGGSPAQGM